MSEGIIIALISGLCVAVPNIIITIISYLKNKTANTKATILNTKSNLMIIYNTSKNQGYITKFQFQLFCELFDFYEKLGGNGFMHKIQAEVNQMVIKE